MSNFAAEMAEAVTDFQAQMGRTVTYFRKVPTLTAGGYTAATGVRATTPAGTIGIQAVRGEIRTEFINGVAVDVTPYLLSVVNVPTRPREGDYIVDGNTTYAVVRAAAVCEGKAWECACRQNTGGAVI